MTPFILYGTDRNRNGADDDGGGSVDRGLVDYITVHSRELNVDSTGTLRVWINGDDIKAIYDALIPAVGGEMAAYIIAAKVYGTTKLDSQGNPTTGGQVAAVERAEERAEREAAEALSRRPASATRRTHHRCRKEPGDSIEQRQGHRLGHGPDEYPRQSSPDKQQRWQGSAAGNGCGQLPAQRSQFTEQSTSLAPGQGRN